MAPGYWILIACIALLVAVQIIRDRRTSRRISELKATGERMKDEFREHEAELRKYKDMCRDLADSNDHLRAQLAEYGLAGEEISDGPTGEGRSAQAVEHLHHENRDLAYREGLLRGKDFSEQTLVQDLRQKAEDCDVEATLLCFDSGIRMSFTCEKENGAGRPVLRVILRVPEGGACCIYEDGTSSPEEDWPPVLACLDTMFARGREVYLSYDFSRSDQED